MYGHVTLLITVEMKRIAWLILLIIILVIIYSLLNDRQSDVSGNEQQDLSINNISQSKATNTPTPAELLGLDSNTYTVTEEWTFRLTEVWMTYKVTDKNTDRFVYVVNYDGPADLFLYDRYEFMVWEMPNENDIANSLNGCTIWSRCHIAVPFDEMLYLKQYDPITTQVVVYDDASGKKNMMTSASVETLLWSLSSWK